MTLMLTPSQLKKEHLIKNGNLIEEYIMYDKSIKNDNKSQKERIEKYLG